MSRKRTLHLLSCIIIFCSPIITKADMCFKSFEQDTAEAQVIFIGKVIKVDFGTYWTSGQAKSIFTFQIEKSYKGLWEWYGFISIVAPVGGCCIGNLVKDSNYLVFAYGNCIDSRLFWTNDCSNTGPVSQKKDDIIRLGKHLNHSPKQEQLNYILKDEILQDSLLLAMKDLNLEVDTVKKQKDTLTIHLRTWYFITFILILLLVGLIIKLINKNAINE